ncbi:replication-relaxation family protein [Deinococcus fonticola]|uniref:replication-relaxation family protein n=1 Tax=Deinococcus fonticola TaxID=2528713 RepID=UPI0010755F7E|nr:replication-relaxation family protein [Deinococcus fonticola]
MTIRPGPRPRHEGVSEQEREAFRQLLRDGAWTPDETKAALGRKRMLELHEENYLSVTYTAMGLLVLPKAHGRVAATGSCDKPRSFARCINTAYQRLALQRLGWEVILDPARRPPTARDDLTPVQTPEGTVLLTAQFGSGRGCSVEKLESLVTQWRSEALFHNLRVVVLTPNVRRGKRLQERESSWLKLVHCLPLAEAKGRVMYPASDDPRASEAALHVPTDTALPELTRQILCLSRDARLHHARRALAVDSVMSTQQLRRHYGLEAGDLQDTPYVHALIHPCHGRYGLEVSTRFFLASPRMQYVHHHHLAHRAGLAEMRMQLSVEADTSVWQTEPRSRLSYEQPDAIWCTPKGSVAVEYDTGSYSMSTIQKKRETFSDRGFAATLWGVPAAKRQQRLQREFGEEVMLAQWFNRER